MPSDVGVIDSGNIYQATLSSRPLPQCAALLSKIHMEAEASKKIADFLRIPEVTKTSSDLQKQCSHPSRGYYRGQD